jgi:hypothetical protein
MPLNGPLNVGFIHKAVNDIRLAEIVSRHPRPKVREIRRRHQWIDADFARDARIVIHVTEIVRIENNHQTELESPRRNRGGFDPWD